MNRFRVRGDSMWPSLPDGTLVVVDDRPGRLAQIRRGDIVVARHPFRRDTLLIKRVASVDPDSVVLHGDAAHGSDDSRAWGPLSRDRLLGVVVETLRAAPDSP